MNKCDKQHVAISFDGDNCPVCILLEGIERAKSLLEGIDSEDSDDVETNTADAVTALDQAMDNMGKSRTSF